MQIKTTVKYHLTPVRWLLQKRQEITRVGRDVEKREPLCTIGGNVKWRDHYEKQYDGTSESLKLNYLLIQQSHSWVYIQKNLNKYLEEISTYLCCSIIHISQDMEII